VLPPLGRLEGLVGPLERVEIVRRATLASVVRSSSWRLPCRPSACAAVDAETPHVAAKAHARPKGAFAAWVSLRACFHSGFDVEARLRDGRKGADALTARLRD
jgi:hypothetical protein